jgi:hypothetical protein
MVSFVLLYFEGTLWEVVSSYVSKSMDISFMPLQIHYSCIEIRMLTVLEFVILQINFAVCLSQVVGAVIYC